MKAIEMTDQPPPQRRDMPVQVILERRPAEIGTWVDETWSAIGIVVGEAAPGHRDDEPVRQDDAGVDQFIVSGLRLKLYPDECESYYHNLLSPQPRCYVVAHVEGDGERPEPFLVSMSFDEAHAYLEGEDEIYAVDIPPEIYHWTEAFVLSYYAPQQRRKRKRVEWRTETGRRS